MIELQIKGPRKKEIQELLRQKSHEYKDNLQMLRMKYGSLKEYETKKFTQISLPKLNNARRKNDLAKVISLSVLSKIQQNKSLTDQEAQHLAKLSPQKRSNRLLIKTQVKEDFSDGDIFHGYQQILNTKHQTNILKQRITKVLDLGQKRKFSLSRKKSLKSIHKIPRAITVNSTQRPTLDVCSDSLSRKYKLKMKAALEKDRELMKEQRSIFMKIIDKRLSPSICVIKKFKTQPPENQRQGKQKTQILRKIRFKEQSKEQRHKSEKPKFKTIQDVIIDVPPFQVSLGPWGTTQAGFNC